jgi:HEAT repeat protein
MGIFCLGYVGPDAKEAIPQLLALLKTTGRDEKPDLTEALGNIHQNAPLVPALLPQLQDNSYAIRLCTVQALAKFGPEAKDAIPALTALLEDDDDEVSDAAVEALAAVRSE